MVAAQVAHGIEPGVHVSLKTSSEMVYTTVTFAAIHSLLNAYSDWQVGGWGQEDCSVHAAAGSAGPFLKLGEWQAACCRMCLMVGCTAVLVEV